MQCNMNIPTIISTVSHLPIVTNTMAELCQTTKYDSKSGIELIKVLLSNCNNSDLFYPKQLLQIVSRKFSSNYFVEKDGSFIHSLKKVLNNDKMKIRFAHINYFKYIRILSIINEPEVQYVKCFLKQWKNSSLIDYNLRMRIKYIYYVFTFQETMIHLLYKLRKTLYTIQLIYLNKSDDKLDGLSEVLFFNYYLQLEKCKNAMNDLDFIFSCDSFYQVTTTMKDSIYLWKHLKKLWGKIREQLCYITPHYLISLDPNVAISLTDVKKMIVDFGYTFDLVELFCTGFLKLFYISTIVLDSLSTLTGYSQSASTLFQLPYNNKCTLLYQNELTVFNNMVDNFPHYTPIELQMWTLINNYCKSEDTAVSLIRITGPVCTLFSVYSISLIRRYVINPLFFFKRLLTISKKPNSCDETYGNMFIMAERILKEFYNDKMNKKALFQFGISLKSSEIQFSLYLRNSIFQNYMQVTHMLKGLAYSKTYRIYNDIVISLANYDMLRINLETLVNRLSSLDVISGNCSNYTVQFLRRIRQNLQKDLERSYKIFIKFLTDTIKKLDSKNKILKLLNEEQREITWRNVRSFLKEIQLYLIDRGIIYGLDTTIEHKSLMIQNIKEYGENYQITISRELNYMENENVFINFIHNGAVRRQQELMELLTPWDYDNEDWNLFPYQDMNHLKWLMELTKESVSNLEQDYVYSETDVALLSE